MKSNKFKILILIAIILTLICTILVRENQHQNTIVEYLDREIQKEQARLETYNELTDNCDILLKDYEALIGTRAIKWHGDFMITGYIQQDEGCNNITSIGVNLDKSWTKYFEFVAVDPDIIPYGTTIYIKIGNEIISALAVDCGDAIVGKHLDFYCKDLEEVYELMAKIEKYGVSVGWIK